MQVVLSLYSHDSLDCSQNSTQSLLFISEHQFLFIRLVREMGWVYATLNLLTNCYLFENWESKLGSVYSKVRVKLFILSVFSSCKQRALGPSLKLCFTPCDFLQASHLEVTFTDCWALLCFLLPPCQHLHVLDVVSMCKNESKWCEISLLFICIYIVVKVRLLTCTAGVLKLVCY